MPYPPNWPGDPLRMHFRLQHANLGVLDLDCDSGYVVQAYDLGHPEVREVRVPNSLDDGTFDVSRFYGARAISLDIALKPHSGTGPSSPFIAAEAVLRDRLLAYTYPGIRPTLVFTEHQDDRVKQVLLRGADASVAVSQKNYNKLNVSWVAPRGVLLSYDERCYLYTFSSATADTATQTIINNGSAPAHWQAVLSGEAVRPRFISRNIHDPADIKVLQLDYASGLGDVVIVDSFSRTVQVNGVPTGYRYVNDLSEWFQVNPGISELTIEHDTYTAEGYPFAYWQPARYLDATVGGPVSTADPGPIIPPGHAPLTSQFTMVFKTRGPDTVGGAAQQTIAGQFATAGQQSWLLRRVRGTGEFYWSVSTTGTGTAQTTAVPAAAPSTTGPETLALSVWLNDGGTSRFQVKRYDPVTKTWSNLGAGASNTFTAPFDSNAAVYIGASGGNEPFNGSIYWVEMRTGLDPAAGNLLWRYAANDIPDGAKTWDDTPDVDTNADGIADGWQAYVSGTPTGASRSIVAGRQRMTATLPAAARYGVEWNTPASPKIAVSPSRSYTARARLSGTLPSQSNIIYDITWYTSADGVISTSTRTLTALTGTPTDYWLTATAPASAAKASVRVYGNGVTAASTPFTLDVEAIEMTDTYTDPRGRVWAPTSHMGIRSEKVVGWVDTFERAGPAIGANWINTLPHTGTGTIQPFTIATGAAVAPVDSGAASMYWNQPQTADQAIEIEVENVFDNNGFFWLYTNGNLTDPACVMCEFNFYMDPDELYITFDRINAAGGLSTLPNDVTIPYPASEPITLRMESDASGALRAYVNGSLVLTDTITPVVVGSYTGMAMNPDSFIGVYDSPRILKASGGTSVPLTNWAIPPGTTPPNNPAPTGKPPWAWTTQVDPDTGQPGQLEVQFCFYDTFV